MSYRNFKSGNPENNRIFQRKYVSPNDQKHSGNDLKNNKLTEYGSLGREKINSQVNHQLISKSPN